MIFCHIDPSIAENINHIDLTKNASEVETFFASVLINALSIVRVCGRYEDRTSCVLSCVSLGVVARLF